MAHLDVQSWGVSCAGRASWAWRRCCRRGAAGRTGRWGRLLLSVVLVVVLLDVERVVPVEMFRAPITVDCIDETAGECRLIKQSIVGAEEVVAVADCTMMVDLQVGLVGADMARG